MRPDSRARPTSCLAAGAGVKPRQGSLSPSLPFPAMPFHSFPMPFHSFPAPAPVCVCLHRLIQPTRLAVGCFPSPPWVSFLLELVYLPIGCAPVPAGGSRERSRAGVDALSCGVCEPQDQPSPIISPHPQTEN